MENNRITITDNKFTPIEGNKIIQRGTLEKIEDRNFAKCSKTEYNLKCSETSSNGKEFFHYIKFETWNDGFRDDISDNFETGDLVQITGTVRNGNYKKADGTWYYGLTYTAYQITKLQSAERQDYSSSFEELEDTATTFETNFDNALEDISTDFDLDLDEDEDLDTDLSSDISIDFSDIPF